MQATQQTATLELGCVAQMASAEQLVTTFDLWHSAPPWLCSQQGRPNINPA